MEVKVKKIPKSQVTKWDKVLKKHQDAVAKQRDSLDDTLQELNMLRENCSQAWDDMQSARDHLSELV